MSTTIIIGCWFIVFLGLLLRDVLHKRELKGETPEEYLSHQYDYELGSVLCFKIFKRVPIIGYLGSSFLFYVSIIFIPALIVSLVQGTLISPKENVMGLLQDNALLWGVVAGTVFLFIYRKIMDFMPDTIMSLVKNKNNIVMRDEINKKETAYISWFADYLFQTKDGRTRNWLIFDISFGALLMILVAYAQYLKVLDPGIFLGKTDFTSHWGNPEYLGGNIVLIYIWFVLVYYVRIVISNILRLAWAMRQFGTKLDKAGDLDIEPLHPDGAGGLGKFGKLTWRMALLILPITAYLFFWESDRGENFIFYMSVIFVFIMIPIIFIIPLWGVHRGMSKAKNDELNHLSRHFNESAGIYNRWLENRDQSEKEEGLIAQRNLVDVSSLYERVLKMPVWPFNTAILIRVGGFMLLSIWPLVTDLIK